ncbi:hypothetical protein, partial [Hornefia butyriciproducens]|uniref:hypothetical protein n=1 Tax=Hornefia butyriciproducens TaxID=2652293 RepID=UPI002A909E8E
MVIVTIAATTNKNFFLIFLLLKKSSHQTALPTLCFVIYRSQYFRRDGVEEVYDDGEDNAYRRTAFNTQEDVKKYFDKITFLGCTNKTKRL